MAKHILKCPACNKYTLKEKCCIETIFPHPAKFSLQDKYGEYRRKAKIIN